METKNEEKSRIEAVTFTKEQIVKCGKYKSRRDLLNVLLAGTKQYTFDDVDKLVNNFMKGKVE